MLLAGYLMLDTKRGKDSLFNPVSSDQYPVSGRVHKQRTPQNLSHLLSFRLMKTANVVGVP